MPRERIPAVSLLVPVHNRAGLLGACLDSALAQTMPNLEVVVVDGASTDGTWDVCLRYASADARVRVFRDPVNTGPVRGWWRCLEEARGEYGTFLWSDDLLMPTFLERTFPLLVDDKVGFVFTAAEIGAQPGSGSVHYLTRGGPTASSEYIGRALEPQNELPVSPACGLFRIRDLRESFIFELPTEPSIDLTATGAGTDLLLYLLTARRYPSVFCVAEPLAFFRAHPGSITIGGDTGRVAFGYAMARSWFAGMIGRREASRRILARHWISRMWATRQLVTPARAAVAYGNIVDARGLCVSAIAVVTRGALAQARRVRHG